MAALPAATPESVHKLLADLVGRPVTVKKTTAPLAVTPPLAVATYAAAATSQLPADSGPGPGGRGIVM